MHIPILNAYVSTILIIRECYFFFTTKYIPLFRIYNINSILPFINHTFDRRQYFCTQNFTFLLNLIYKLYISIHTYIST